MRIPWYMVAFALVQTHANANANPNDKEQKKEEDVPVVVKPCTIRSPNTGSFFDLNPIHITLPDPEAKPIKDAKVDSWHARGYDYGANFTVNFCGGVVEELEDVVGVDSGMWKNVSGFYKKDGKTYSIGQQNDELVIRGRKLVLNYTDGSPCPSSNHQSKRAILTRPKAKAGKVQAAASQKENAGGSSNSRQPDMPSTLQTERRKSTIISLLCERDPLAAKAALSFVGASQDECTYFFELRSSAACPAVNVEQRQVGPSTLFGLIFGVAFVVYLVGGIVYQRAVMHQRGLRQLPNYTLWAGMCSFIKDMIIVAFYSCTRCCMRRKGYNQVRPPNGHTRGAPDDENRIIDQLDEEWDD